MNKEYITPAMRVVRIQQQCHILSGSINDLNTNAGLNYGNGGSGTARSRSNDGWDDDWSE
jgi:hypothetical protein